LKVNLQPYAKFSLCPQALVLTNSIGLDGWLRFYGRHTGFVTNCGGEWTFIEPLGTEQRTGWTV